MSKLTSLERSSERKKTKTEQKSRITLMQRTKTFNDLCRAKQNTLHPKSENLSPLVSDIVKKLEDSFDGLSARMKSSPSKEALSYFAFYFTRLKTTS